MIVHQVSIFEFCNLIHSVFNLGTKASWKAEESEYRLFRSMNDWTNILKDYGLEILPKGMLFQDGDPSKNALNLFKKI